ncbi:UNVERIFIED_CONTAM: hypothetical protein Slati_4328500 [Sesamum latifolium]|uniref:Uncharacterized protein n=1 Tax=Sesamum latifolium TaxID=2727402 RepID=A0AAW2SMG3_9LAMI
MDARFDNLGFAANPQSNAFKNLCNSIQIGGVRAEVVYCADITLQLDSPGFANPFISPPKEVKRKGSSVSGPVNQQAKSSLGLRLGHSSSSTDSKGSTATACTSLSSAKETEEESLMDLELDFTLHLGSDKSSGSEKSANSNLKSLNVWPKTAPNMENIYILDQSLVQIKPTSPGLSSSAVTTPKSSVTCTSGITKSQQQLSSSTKQCQFQGYFKGARGASGLCIAHGGGRRC